MRRVFQQSRSLFLNHFLIAVLCAGLIFGLSGCWLKRIDDEDEKREDEEVTDTEPSDTDEASTVAPTETSAETSIETTVETSAETFIETTESVPEVTTTEPPAPTFTNPANMYSSYAHMLSFDPATGWAEFDYFDILKGQDAIDWLVENEGYTVAEAEEEVNDYADSEYVYKNVNPQLRTADMNAVAITVMYDASGTKVDGAESVPVTYGEFLDLYNAHPDLLVDGDFFFYVTVTGGVISKVDQVYWP